MRNRSAKRACLGFFDINVYPLMVAGGLREQVDLFLRDGNPFADGDFLADQRGKFARGFEMFSWHHCSQWR